MFGTCFMFVTTFTIQDRFTVQGNKHFSFVTSKLIGSFTDDIYFIAHKIN